MLRAPLASPVTAALQSDAARRLRTSLAHFKFGVIFFAAGFAAGNWLRPALHTGSVLSNTTPKMANSKMASFITEPSQAPLMDGADALTPGFAVLSTSSGRRVVPLGLGDNIDALESIFDVFGEELHVGNRTTRLSLDGVGADERPWHLLLQTLEPAGFLQPQSNDIRKQQRRRSRRRRQAWLGQSSPFYGICGCRRDEICNLYYWWKCRR